MNCSNNTAYNNTACDNTACDDPACDDPACDDPACDDPACDNPASDDPACDDPACDPACDDPAYDDTACDVSACSNDDSPGDTKNCTVYNSDKHKKCATTDHVTDNKSNSVSSDNSSVQFNSSHCIEDDSMVTEDVNNHVNVHLIQNLCIPNNTIMTVSVMINNGIKENIDLLLYPNGIKKSVVLASVLTRAIANNVAIHQANLYDKDITLKSGTKLS